ncbi:MAG: DUF4395 domain-containing protein [Acidimicrobiales bacterium]|nr:DUF4395 domain-containing protein [Acidimicrobiales bacterium]
MARFFTFPNPVNEVAARAVAAGVVVLSVLYLVTGHPAVLVVLAYGFVARVASGPRFSPLGLLATRVIAPRLPHRTKLVPGPPKRFAQSIGAVFSVGALVAHLAGATGAATVLIAGLVAAAGLEAVFALCLGCRIFALLMRLGVVPEAVCADCADISNRIATPVDSAA